MSDAVFTCAIKPKYALRIFEESLLQSQFCSWYSDKLQQQEGECKHRAEMILWNTNSTEAPASKWACYQTGFWPNKLFFCFLHCNSFLNNSESTTKVSRKVTCVWIPNTLATYFFVLASALPHESQNIRKEEAHMSLTASWESTGWELNWAQRTL